MKCLIDFWADDFADVGHHSQKTAIHDSRSYCPYWQAICWRLLPGKTHQGYLFRLLLSCVSTTNEPLQVLDGIEPRPGNLGSFVPFSTSECDCRVHIGPNIPSWRENALLFQNNISGVKAWGTFRLFFSWADSILYSYLSNIAMKLSV